MDIDLEQNLEGCRSSRDDDDNNVESCELVDEHNLNTTTSDFTTSGRLNDKLVMYEPQTGLEFETKEEAYAYYREYARSVGFGITIKASRRSKKTSKFIDVKVACSRFGTKRESSTTMNPRSCMKTNCKAGMQMKRTREGKWIIYSIVKEHNHKICPDDFYNGLRGQKKQPVAVSCQKKADMIDFETEADFKTDNGPLSTFETQMSSVYTEAVFRKFQVEFLGMVSCQLQKESEDDGHVIFRVDDFAGSGCQNSFVIWNEAELHKTQRFNDICKLAVKLGEEGSLSQEAYSIACQALETAFKHCVDENTFGKHLLGYDSYANEVEKICKVGSKKPKKKKYRKRQAHIEPEGPAKRLQDSCMQMEQSNSRAHDCYIAEQNVHGMELSNRNHPHGGYYGSQQTMQGMDGILEPISPIHESYFLNQLGGHELIHSVVTNISHYGIQHRQPATVLASVNLPVSSDYEKSRDHIDKDHLADSVPLAGNGSQEERPHYLYEDGLHQ
ncbi:hypothetical protein ACFE04_024207 [Oxalis oulophora]